MADGPEGTFDREGKNNDDFYHNQNKGNHEPFNKETGMMQGGGGNSTCPPSFGVRGVVSGGVGDMNRGRFRPPGPGHHDMGGNWNNNGPPRSGMGGMDGPKNNSDNENIWAEARSPDGKTYYYHTKTRETTWDRPEGPGVRIVRHEEWSTNVANKTQNIENSGFPGGPKGPDQQQQHHGQLLLQQQQQNFPNQGPPLGQGPNSQMSIPPSQLQGPPMQGLPSQLQGPPPGTLLSNQPNQSTPARPMLSSGPPGPGASGGSLGQFRPRAPIGFPGAENGLSSSGAPGVDNTPKPTKGLPPNMSQQMAPSLGGPVPGRMPPPVAVPQSYVNNHYGHSQPPPQQQQPQSQNYNGYGQHGDSYGANHLSNQMSGLSVTQQGFNKLWGTDQVDLLQQKNLIPPRGIKPPEIRFQHEYMNSINCSSELFRCTLTKIPETKTLLNKARLPLGILIHPFKDLTQLPVIQCSTIVRCRTCRTYINPYVYFVDQRRWKCNLCTRVNDLPEEFQYDPVTKTYGDPSRRPEVRAATIEFLAPADYMVRPPQAAVYLYLLDVSATAVDTGYLKAVCDILLENMAQIPGDSRSQIGFITYDSTIHFYNLAENLSQPHQMVVCDIDDIFIPCPDNLLVSLHENREIIRHLLTQLPTRFLESSDNCSALGAALQAAHKLLAPIGGRITIFQCTLPTLGPGALTNREANIKNIKDLPSALNPSTDFYKKLALDCSSQYIAVDCFFLNSQYVDIASISCVAKFSGGCVHHFPNYHITNNPQQSFLFEQSFQRYVIRKIGFEAVMRVRCSRGMSIHTFHGNLFVRSTDLLSLPNCNPDAGFGMQVSIDENLSDCQTVCFQAALLYTSSKGERRIRVHTLCLPVVGNVNDVLNGADQQCIIGLVAKMAVDRSLSSSLSDAREAFINAVVDVLSAYITTQNSLPNLSLIAPPVLKMLPLYTHGILRSPGFRSDLKVRLDERVHFMNQMKVLPLSTLIQSIYPDLYPIHNVANTPLVLDCDDETPDFPLLHLCSSRIEAQGVYVMDRPEVILTYVCRSVSAEFCREVLNVANFASLSELNEFPELDNTWSIRIRNFIQCLQASKPHLIPVRIIREDSRERLSFVNNLVEDRGDSSSSYYEFLQQLKNMVH